MLLEGAVVGHPVWVIGFGLAFAAGAWFLLGEAELARRGKDLTPAARDPKTLRGYDRLYAQHVLQAEEGCDFDFMRPLD